MAQSLDKKVKSLREELRAAENKLADQTMRRRKRENGAFIGKFYRMETEYQNTTTVRYVHVKRLNDYHETVGLEIQLRLEDGELEWFSVAPDMTNLIRKNDPMEEITKKEFRKVMTDYFTNGRVAGLLDRFL